MPKGLSRVEQKVYKTSLLAVTAAALCLIGCVDLTEPWKQHVTGSGGSSAGGASGNVGIEVGGGGAGGDVAAEDSVSGGPVDGGLAEAGGGLDLGGGGAGGSIDVAMGRDGGTDAPESIDAPNSGGAGGGIDARDDGSGGMGGGIDARDDGSGGAGGGIDAPISGAGGTATGGKGGGMGGTTGTGGTTSGTGDTGGTTTGTGGVGTGGATTGTGGMGAGGATTGTGGVGTGGAGGTGGVTVAGLVAYYACDETSGTTLTDKSGNGNDGTLHGGYSIGTGKVGTGALALNSASSGYVEMPSGVLSALSAATEMTISTWVYITSTVQWQRIFDIGSSTNLTTNAQGDTTNHYMNLVPLDIGNNMAFSITASGLDHQNSVVSSANFTFPTNTWTHVALVLGGGTGEIYINGAVSNTNTISLRPADLGTLGYAYIGKSWFTGDPFLNGQIDDFRIYSRALSAAEVLALSQFTGP